MTDPLRELGGSVNERSARKHRDRVPALLDLLDELFGRLDGVASGRAALKPGEEQILVPPHHALGATRRSAGVDDVEVVAGTGSEASLLRAARKSGLVLDRLLLGNVVRSIVDHDERLEWIEPAAGFVDDRDEPLLGDDALEICVLDHVADFWSHEAIVHVDPDHTDLEER